MSTQGYDAKMTSRLLFRLLPFQILLAVVGSINAIISSLFASNAVGMTSMSAVGLYQPFNMVFNALGTILVGGSTIMCGRYMGQNQLQKMQNIFSLNITCSILIGLCAAFVLAGMSMFDLSGWIAKDPEVRKDFNQYVLGQAIGIIPLILGTQLSAFLLVENKNSLTTIASLVYIVCNLLLNFLFVQVLKMQAFGLALASSVGLWIFLGVQAGYFFSKKAHLRMLVRPNDWKELKNIFVIGVPGAASYLYQTLRGIVVNSMMTTYVGTAGLSAFAAANTLLGFAWAVPTGMLAVSRMLMSISIGEEDRRTLTDVMRNMFRRFIPLMCAIVVVLIILAEPLTRLYYRDPSNPVYMMTVWGFRLLPLCMPLSIISMHFVCYGQASDKQVLVHVLSIVDGVIGVVSFMLVFMPILSKTSVYAAQNTVYWASFFNGVCTTLVVIIYAWICNKKCPKNVEELMVIPKDFGVDEADRMDLTLHDMQEVVQIAEGIQQFCLAKGVDEKRSYLAGLFMEEMAGNVVKHGCTKDKKQHAIDGRVVYKDGAVILRIKDDCVPFDPGERQKIVDPEDPTKNFGVRMIYKIASAVQYQNMLGLNALTIHI